MNKLFKLAAIGIFAGGIVFAGSAIATPVNLVTNGSFESSAVPPNTWVASSSLPDWTVGPNGVEIRNNVAGSAQDGKNFVELDNRANSWIEQTVATVIGQQYNLTFWYSPRQNVASNSNGIDVLLNGLLFDSVTGYTNNWSDWMLQSLSFTADSSNTTLRFAASGISDGAGRSLDNISVTAALPAPTGVPEPGTLMLLLVSIMGGAVVAHRNQKGLLPRAMQSK